MGERKLGAKLAGLGAAVISLHDRCVPNSRANIDHVVIGPGGAYVVDAKRYQNAKIAVRRSGGPFSPARSDLMVSGRDRTKLIEAMTWQVAAVRAAVGDSLEFAAVPITASLCFVDAEFPLFGTIVIDGVHVLGLNKTAKLVCAVGALDASARSRLAQHLGARLLGKAAA